MKAQYCCPQAKSIWEEEKDSAPKVGELVEFQGHIFRVKDVNEMKNVWLSTCEPVAPSKAKE